jgi:hypothetical protein
MKKPTRRSIRSGLVALLLLGAMFGALNSSGTFTKLAFAQNYGGGTLVCNYYPAGCTFWGCNGNPPNMTCSFSGPNCPSGIGCTKK